MTLTALAGPALVTLLALLLFFATAFQVGRMRGKHGVQAPAVSGHRDFEIALRVQANTLESMALVLPALWLAAVFGDARWATAAGVLWLVGRVWYALGYIADPARRGPGFLVGMLGWLALMVLACWGVLRALIG